MINAINSTRQPMYKKSVLKHADVNFTAKRTGLIAGLLGGGTMVGGIEAGLWLQEDRIINQLGFLGIMAASIVTGALAALWFVDRSYRNPGK